MAGGQLSPRQKMINLMYLVFIAMLAMQMSKEVLTAFGYLNERLTTFNERQNVKNEASYDGLAVKFKEQPQKYEDEYEKAQVIRALSTELFDHIENVKTLMLADEKEPENYEALDKSDFLDVYFYQKGKVSENGQAFLDVIAKYREGVIDALGSEYPQVSQSIEEYFDTNDIPNKDGVSQDINWIDHNFVGFPVVASLTKLTVMQSDIRGAERNILSAMLGVQLAADAGISANTYETIFLPTKSSFFPGEQVTGKIVLGRYDATLIPSQVVVNGSEVTEFERGGAVLNITAGNVGEQELIGKFVFKQDGKDVEIPIEAKYNVVAKPNGAVIAADKMNVVYRGLNNPMTISVPGVADNNVKPTAPGLRRGNGVGNYVMVPGQGKEVRINVAYTLPDGSTESDSKVYRIKDIPKPMATVRRESGFVQMPKSSLAKTTVRVELPDFLFDLDFKIQSFKIKVPGQATIIVTGDKLNAQAQNAVNRARVGDLIAIFDVKSSIIGVTGLRVPDASPVNIEIQ